MNAPRAYYNEIDERAAQWLRNLISAGMIAPGDVDTRSITDVRAGDLDGYTQCHFFAGIGGWSAAARRAGIADSDPIWTGSCPCQPGSRAGKKKGFADKRHLWPAWFNLIRERRPAIVFGEQVAAWAPWLRLVRRNLEAVDYAMAAMPIEAASAGADHIRDRYWFMAYALGDGWQQSSKVLRARQSQPARTSQVLRALADADGGGQRQSPKGVQARQSEPCLAGNVGFAHSLGWPPGEQARSAARHGNSTVAAGGGNLDDAFGDRWSPSGSDHAGNVGIKPASTGEFDWVACADGKSRRVKPGIRLLAHGVSGRVGLLRGFGNAIDLRPATEFIIAASEAAKQLTEFQRPEAV